MTRAFLLWMLLGVAPLTALAQGPASAPLAGREESLSAIQRQKDTLVVGSEQDYPPFATGMTDATAGGFTVELWKAVAAEADLKYTIRVRPFHQLLQEFKDGKIDVLINLAQSDERRQFADFTVPHVIVHGAIFVRKGESGIRSENDFGGKSIIVLKADLAHDYAASKGWEKQLVLVNTSAQGMRLLASGQHDAMLLSTLAGTQTLQALRLTNIEALKVKAGFSQKFSFVVEKGRTELLAKINEGLALTKSNGTYNALHEKWFGIYEAKDGLRDMQKYILLIVASFLVIGAYFFYRRQVERKAADEQLRDSATRMRSILDTVADGIITIDERGIVETFNPAAERIFGYAACEVIGRSVKMLIPEPYQSGHDGSMERYRATGEARIIGREREIVGHRKDGSTFPLDFALSESRPGGERHYTGIVRDITERKRIEETLRAQSGEIARKNVELEEANRAKSDFLANMSHELRTPLNSIIGFSEMLKDGALGELDKRQRGFTADIFEAGTHLLSLINDILDLSKVEAGMQRLDLDPVAIEPLLEASLQVVREKAMTHRIRLATLLDPGLGTVLVDKRKLKQIAYNLLANAVKFTPEGGSVTLRARRCSRAEVALDASRPGRLVALPPGDDDEFLELAIEDSGVGIAEEHLAKLFEPFVQVDSSIARRQGGTGLGLALVRRLAELHGGAVGVESRPGAGSRFRVWLSYQGVPSGLQPDESAPMGLR